MVSKSYKIGDGGGFSCNFGFTVVNFDQSWGESKGKQESSSPELPPASRLPSPSLEPSRPSFFCCVILRPSAATSDFRRFQRHLLPRRSTGAPSAATSFGRRFQQHSFQPRRPFQRNDAPLRFFFAAGYSESTKPDRRRHFDDILTRISDRDIERRENRSESSSCCRHQALPEGDLNSDSAATGRKPRRPEEKYMAATRAAITGERGTERETDSGRGMKMMAMIDFTELEKGCETMAAGGGVAVADRAAGNVRVRKKPATEVAGGRLASKNFLSHTHRVFCGFVSFTINLITGSHGCRQTTLPPPQTT
ncbi:hypothetical protein LXL04_036535 [Taraxacum kok-saghyz]